MWGGDIFSDYAGMVVENHPIIFRKGCIECDGQLALSQVTVDSSLMSISKAGQTNILFVQELLSHPSTETRTLRSLVQ